MKGQMFSVDVLLAAGIVVLGIGIILNNFEIITIQSKEARFTNELTTIAANATAMLLKESCEMEENWKNQGYLLTNCSKNTGSTTKEQLMIPNEFKCYFEIDDTALNVNGCEDQKPNEKIMDIGVIERKYVSITNNLTKKNYEKCIKNNINNICDLTEKTLKAYIWR